jgi:hypothetical protein
VLVIAWIAFEWDMARYNASYIFSGRKRNWQPGPARMHLTAI